MKIEILKTSAQAAEVQSEETESIRDGCDIP